MTSNFTKLTLPTLILPSLSKETRTIYQTSPPSNTSLLAKPSHCLPFLKPESHASNSEHVIQPELNSRTRLRHFTRPTIKLLQLSFHPRQSPSKIPQTWQCEFIPSICHPPNSPLHLPPYLFSTNQLRCSRSQSPNNLYDLFQPPPPQKKTYKLHKWHKLTSPLTPGNPLTTSSSTSPAPRAAAVSPKTVSAGNLLVEAIPSRSTLRILGARSGAGHLRGMRLRLC